MTAMSKKREMHQHWQRVAKLVLANEDVLTVSRPSSCSSDFPSEYYLRTPESKFEFGTSSAFEYK